jgi:glucose/mannose-6-phosphate isomerase
MTMKALIEAFPANIREAIAIANSASFKEDYSGISNVVICGMGGSGIGGTMVKDWLFD